MVAPGIAWLIRLLKDNMVAALPGQVVADRKPRLSSTNNDRLNKFRHIEFLPQAGIRITGSSDPVQMADAIFRS
jgi:hypothetical protein